MAESDGSRLDNVANNDGTDRPAVLPCPPKWLTVRSPRRTNPEVFP
jgi:hypothetical protein